jgi:hypothetical protein
MSAIHRMFYDLPDYEPRHDKPRRDMPAWLVLLIVAGLLVLIVWTAVQS